MDDTDLHVMVGEIRSDVKTLLARELEHERRIKSLEKSRWYAGGFLGAACVVLAARTGIHFPTG